MNNPTSYAINTADCKATDAFTVIANFLLMNSCSDISLYPDKNIIVVTPTESDANVIEHVKDYIANSDDLNGVTVNPIILYDECRSQLIECGFAPGNILREIIEQQAEHIRDIEKNNRELATAAENNKVDADKYKTDYDRYSKWYYEQLTKNNRIHEQVKAIAVIMSSIFPEDK